MDTFQIKKPGYVDPKMTALCLTEICLCLNSPLWTKYIFLTEKKFKEKMSLIEQWKIQKSLLRGLFLAIPLISDLSFLSKLIRLLEYSLNILSQAQSINFALKIWNYCNLLHVPFFFQPWITTILWARKGNLNNAAIFLLTERSVNIDQSFHQLKISEIENDAARKMGI